MPCMWICVFMNLNTTIPIWFTSTRPLEISGPNCLIAIQPITLISWVLQESHILARDRRGKKEAYIGKSHPDHLENKLGSLKINKIINN
mmetsp:Transcript_1513/g.3187  ORF Transcript_1513/g.3187 Transcript_1513/m.3187 type:complete len:89 (-) Transcript_1513:1124-1390(-)